jgi:hypothetical protein
VELDEVGGTGGGDGHARNDKDLFAGLDDAMFEERVVDKVKDGIGGVCHARTEGDDAPRQ